MEGIDALATSLGRFSALLCSNLVQAVQLFEGQKMRRELLLQLVHLVELKTNNTKLVVGHWSNKIIIENHQQASSRKHQ